MPADTPKLHNLKVTRITYPTADYRYAHPVRITDEGDFYRVDGTHIFEKYKIKNITLDDNLFTIHMENQDVVLTILPR